jgi:hypothetical protein
MPSVGAGGASANLIVLPRIVLEEDVVFFGWLTLWFAKSGSDCSSFVPPPTSTSPIKHHPLMTRHDQVGFSCRLTYLKNNSQNSLALGFFDI